MALVVTNNTFKKLDSFFLMYHKNNGFNAIVFPCIYLDIHLNVFSPKNFSIGYNEKKVRFFTYNKTLTAQVSRK